MSRATVSVGPLGGKGTTMVTVFAGKAWADAKPAARASDAASAAMAARRAKCSKGFMRIG